MIVMVSTNTLSARDPDHSARMKPIEMTSKRPGPSTSSSVGRMTESTVDSVSAREESSRTAVRTESTWVSLKLLKTKPIEPASPKTSGGRESSAKNAASAARPVTRLRKQVPTVETTSRHVASRSVCQRAVQMPGRTPCARGSEATP